jgi:macrolide phosphotransferase
MRLETEVQALRAFTPAVKAELPFLIPHMAGSVRQGDLSTFVYSHLAGSTRPLEALAGGGRAMAQELGRVIAAIHELPKDMVHQADLPSYEADEYRQRKLNELDQAATTGKIPVVLLRRWEHALEDVALWRFSPTVMHGDLHEDHLLIAAGRVSAVTGWTDLSIGDPAEDFAWLAAAEDTAFVETVHAAYAQARAAAVDPHLPRRAALAAEFALAQWLVRGVALDDAGMIREAEGMLATLSADVESIEREQLEAAERTRRAMEERIEWGNEHGNDAFEDEDDLDGDHRGAIDPDESDGDPEGGYRTASDDDPDRDPTDHGQPVPGADGPPAPDRERDGGTDVEGGRIARPGTGSHRYGHDRAAGPADRQMAEDGSSRTEDDPAPHDRSPRDDHDTPSGSSLARARLVAARRAPASASSVGASRITLLRSSGPAAGSPDDVATSALPIVSFGR